MENYLSFNVELMTALTSLTTRFCSITTLYDTAKTENTPLQEIMHLMPVR